MSNKKAKLYFLNSSILTSFGVFRYNEIQVREGVYLLQQTPSECIESAIGHQATAEVLSELLGVPVPVNRIQIAMERGDQAIVFKLKQRLEEHKVLTKEEMKDLDYELGLLERLS